MHQAKRHRILELNTLTNQRSCDTYQIQLIDPVSPIGDPTEQRRIIDRAARIEAARQARGLPAATRLYNRLEASGQRVPAGLKNFLAAHKQPRRS